MDEPSTSKPPRRSRKRRSDAQKTTTLDDVDASEKSGNYAPWLDSIPERTYASTEERLHDEIVAYANYMRPTTEEDTARKQFFSFIERLVKARFPRAEVEPYGSVTTGLTLLNSDLDICASPNQDVNVKNALYQLASRLRATGLANDQDVFVNRFAPIPIITLNTRPYYGSMAIDIGINNVDGLDTRNLVKSYLDQMPALRPLVLVFKRFLEQRGLNDASKSGLGSYAATLMCINFLQTNPCQRPREALDDPLKTGSLGIILSDFFYYYGSQYPHDDDVYMSISEGKVLASDSESSQLGLDIRCPLSGGNVAKSLGPRLFKDMVRSFKLSHTAILQNESTDRNILGPISSVNQKMIEQRASIHDLVHSGKLGALGNVIAQTTTPWRRNYGSQPVGGGSASFVVPALLPVRSTSGSIEWSDRQQPPPISLPSFSGRRNISVLSEPIDDAGGMIGAKPPRKRRRRRNNHTD